MSERGDGSGANGLLIASGLEVCGLTQIKVSRFQMLRQRRRHLTRQATLHVLGTSARVDAAHWCLFVHIRPTAVVNS